MPSNESVFDRLYRQSTAASRAASVNSPASPTYRSQNSISLNRASHRLRQTSTSAGNVKTVKTSTDKENPEDPPTRPFVVELAPKKYTGPWRITSTSKYDHRSNKALTSLDPGSLKLSAKLQSFYQGDIDARQFACHLIEALFDRDHRPGRHWDYDSPSASPMECEETNTLKFEAEKEATWDWKDIYSVTTAKGTISFNTETFEIRVEDYSYYAAG